jgi:hypothetical protein
MVRRHAERIKRCKVCGGWIAHIRLPAVSGIAQCEFGHELVAKHLRDDRGTGDRIDRLIAANDGCMWSDQVAEFARATPINEGKVWRRSPSAGELCNGTSHGAMRRCTRIDALHLSRGSGTDTDGERNVSDLLCEHHATRGRQQLRIANAWDWISCRHQDCAGDDRSSKRGETYLIDTNDGTFRMTVA